MICLSAGMMRLLSGTVKAVPARLLLSGVLLAGTIAGLSGLFGEVRLVLTGQWDVIRERNFLGFWKNNQELTPLYRMPVDEALCWGFIPLTGAVFALQHAVEKKQKRPLNALLLIVSAGTLCLNMIQIRWACYALIATIVPYTRMLEEACLYVDRKISRGKKSRPVWVALPVALSVVFPFLFLLTGTAVESLTANEDEEKTKDLCEKETRRLIASDLTDVLGNAPVGLIAHTNYGSQILFQTPYKIVAGNYHRNVEGLRDSATFFETGTEQEARDVLKKRQIRYVVSCRKEDSKERPAFLKEMPAGWTEIPLPDRYKQVVVYDTDRKGPR
jgi:hypothetical protein